MACAYGLGCDAYYQEQLDKLEPQWNQWLGKTKDERIKIAGPPDKCATLSDGGEVCEWSSGGVSGGGSYSAHTGYGSSSVSSWQHRRIFTYDPNHIAIAWSYQGNLGQRSSHNVKAAPQGGHSEVEGK
jgi:hypothetical protein